MATTIRLKDIVDALEMQGDEDRAYVELDSGEVHVLSVEVLDEMEDGFERLPTKFDVHEWEIMEEFSQSL